MKHIRHVYPIGDFKRPRFHDFALKPSNVAKICFKVVLLTGGLILFSLSPTFFFAFNLTKSRSSSPIKKSSILTIIQGFDQD